LNKTWFKKLKYWPSVLIGLLCSLPAQAALFTPPAGDESMHIIGTIFGPNIGNIALGGHANPALMRMFEIFNIIAVSLGTIIVSYIAIISLVNTAQEGKTMGKKWAGIWIPMRSILGMMLLVPTPGAGYSLVQVAVMWIVMQGIGAADQLWNIVLDHFSQQHSPGSGINYHDEDSAPQFAILRDNAEKLTEQLLNSATCAASFPKMIENSRKNNRPWISQSVTDAFHNLRIYKVDSPNITEDANGAVVAGGVFIGVKGNPALYNMCGNYKVIAKVYKSEWPISLQPMVTQSVMLQKAKEIYEKKITTIDLIYSSISTAANEFVKENPPALSQGYKDLAKNIYVSSLASITIPRVTDNDIEQKVEVGKRSGWITAGPFYFSLNKGGKNNFFSTVLTDNDLKAENVPFCKEDTCEDLTDTANNTYLANLNPVLSYPEEKVLIKRSLFKAAKFFAADDYKFDSFKKFEHGFAEELKTAIVNDDTGIFQKVFDALTGDEDIISGASINKLMDSLEKNDQDPLYLLGNFGHQILGATEKNLLEAVKDPAEFIRKITEIRAATNDEELAKISHNMFITTITLGVFLTLWAAGATLALYIPFVPFMIFTVASIGWLILVIEAIVAAPLLALSFVLPSGDELGKVAQGLMILLNIFLRPTLIIFGFILASRLFKAVFTFVHYGISIYVDNIDKASTILSSLALLIMYIVFIVSLTNKSFALIYVLPDKILRWIGGGGEQTDISQETQMTKGSLQRTGDITQKLASYATNEELERKRREIGAHAMVPKAKDEI
jgi:conjugal transfer/type IV secretion protein DotA/TraY